MTLNSEGIKLTVHRYIAILAILIVLAMTVLDGTVVNVALPVLATKFNVSDSHAVWIVTIYQLVITMLLLPLSSLGDIYSYKRNFLIGVSVFTIGSIFCASSQSFFLLIGARAIQGIGAAFIMGVNVALIRLIYPAKILGRGLAINAMVIAISSAAGPTIAGAVLSVASWQWLFLINVPFGILAFLIGYKYLPKNPPRNHRTRFDFISGIANVVVFGLIFYSLGSFALKGEFILNIGLLILGLIIGYFYIHHLHNREQPMFPVDLLHIKLYALSILTSNCSFIAQNVALISLPFLFLNGYGFSEISTGLLMTPWPLATMIVSPFAARWVERHNPGLTASLGMMIYAFGVIMLMTAPMGAGLSEWNIAWRMAICGIGFGMFQTPNNIIMIQATPMERSGAAGGMQSTARLVGQTLGATIVTVVFAFATTPSGSGTPNDGAMAVHYCLIIAICFAVIAGVFSISRFRFTSKNQKLPEKS